MLSNERQQKKPYAMPDRFTLYTRYMCVISQQRLQKKWQRDEGLDVCSCTCRAREALWELSVFPKSTTWCPFPGFIYRPFLPFDPESSAPTTMLPFGEQCSGVPNGQSLPQALAKDIMLCYWARCLTTAVALSTLVFKYKLGNMTKYWELPCHV